MPAAPKENDILFCTDLVNRIRAPFQISSRYAPKDAQLRLLAGHAFLCAIEEAVGSTRDPGVARARLAWWHHELLESNSSGSQHPIPRLLADSGAFKTLDRDCIKTELQAAMARVDREALVSQQALAQMCRELGENQWKLERSLGISASKTAKAVPPRVCAVGLMQVFRESLRSAFLGFWWIPLAVSARIGVSRDALPRRIDRSCASALLQVIQETLDLQHSMGEAVGAGGLPGSSDDVPAVRHWSVYARLESERLARLRASAHEDWLAELSRLRLADVWIAWRQARRFRHLADDRQERVGGR
ncbi:squalene/phytoene synthase family protein [Elongatibacter sediminis]|uniref:Squalene/phytoene synthase family protein n=1 Tax=Elongatibacter sediminis TaxID=3119006 RepID=A0AAW9R6E3_9GAMM